ncbi:MAG: flagellar protein FlaG [Gammaproteobacteria bacterium]|nr:flagellar protein FlaG [Gammaproteobacteria bacterium]
MFIPKAAPPIDGSPQPATAAATAPAATAGAPAAPALPDPSVRAQQAARQLQEYLQRNGHSMEFAVDQTTGRTIVRIYNRSSGELVRQVPSEEMVRIAALLRADAGQASLDAWA